MGNETVLAGVVETARSYFYTFVIGIVILLIGFGLGILAKKITQRFLKKVMLNTVLREFEVIYDLESFLGSVVSFVIYLITAHLFLKQMGITSFIIISVILGAVLMLIALTLLVGLKDVLPNLAGWFCMRKNKQIQVGKKIKIKGISGTIKRIKYLETQIRTEHNDILHLPNSLFNDNNNLENE